MRKLFVGNMNVTSTKESVTEYFEQFGELENVYCPTGKGYAFMTFKHASGIDAVQRARYVLALYINLEKKTIKPSTLTILNSSPTQASQSGRQACGHKALHPEGVCWHPWHGLQVLLFNHFNLFMNLDDLNARSKKLYVCGARSYGQEATGGHSGLTDDVSFSMKLHNWPIFTFSLF